MFNRLVTIFYMFNLILSSFVNVLYIFLLLMCIMYNTFVICNSLLSTQSRFEDSRHNNLLRSIKKKNTILRLKITNHTKNNNLAF